MASSLKYLSSPLTKVMTEALARAKSNEASSTFLLAATKTSK